MNIAEKIIKPNEAKVFRTVFLYTGQGESTIMAIPTGSAKEDYMYVLVDSDLDKGPKEIDLVALLKDLFKTSGKLSTFINTHPHKDHMGGIKSIYDNVNFDEVWHSNHKPGGEHDTAYSDFKHVLKEIGKGNEYHLLATSKENEVYNVKQDKAINKKLGLIDFQVLHPSEYLCEDIEDGTEDERNNRIHEQCGVIKFSFGKTPKSILITGDSDKCAWEEHITKNYKKYLKSNVLSASHHGSRTFFKVNENDKDVYEDHIKEIKPDYVIVSAPKKIDSQHEHPHDDALVLYKKHIEDEDNILHLGSGPYSVILDIKDDGTLSVKTDKELIEAYGKNDDEKEQKNENTNCAQVGNRTTRIDYQPMGR